MKRDLARADRVAERAPSRDVARRSRRYHRNAEGGRRAGRMVGNDRNIDARRRARWSNHVRAHRRDASLEP